MKENASLAPLILRHRPSDFNEVRGHDAVLAPLQRRLAEPGPPHTYLLTGVSGIGKTTVARIIAKRLGCEILEVDAATHSGVDAMRELTDAGFILSGGIGSRMVIVDECHMLSRNAWNAMLKNIEEPPDHLYWCLATTELGKVPETIVTRAYHIPLGRLSDQAIGNYLIDIADAEDWLEKTNTDVIGLVAREAQGSPRQALSLLQACYEAEDAEEAKRIIALQGSAEPLLQVLQILVSNNGGWDSIRPLLAQLGPDDFSEESIIGAGRYIIGAMNRETDRKKAARLWGLLSCLTYPSRGFDPRAVLYTAVGRILWGGE